MSLTTYLSNAGFTSFEGNSQEIAEQIKDLISITSKPNINVMEIGFNAGHSAEILLQNNKTLTLTSFDIGAHDYVSTAKKYIDDVYPGRHKLIIGNSVESVPQFIREFPGVKFDVIFIDGCHEYSIAKADLENCVNLAHSNTIVIMDDTIMTHSLVEWTIGPTTVWREFLMNHKIINIKCADYQPERGMSWGKYNGLMVVGGLPEKIEWST